MFYITRMLVTTVLPIPTENILFTVGTIHRYLLLHKYVFVYVMHGMLDEAFSNHKRC